MLNDTIANALSSVISYEKIGKKEILLHPMSKTLRRILKIMQDNHYIGSFEEITNARGGVAKLHLLGALNKCGVIKPRFNVQVQGYEKFEKKYLPAKEVGIIIVSTSKGIMTHKDAKEKKIGGRLLAYCY